MGFQDRIVKNHAGSLDLCHIVRNLNAGHEVGIHNTYADISDFDQRKDIFIILHKEKCNRLASYIADYRKRFWRTEDLLAGHCQGQS